MVIQHSRYILATEGLKYFFCSPSNTGCYWILNPIPTSRFEKEIADIFKTIVTTEIINMNKNDNKVESAPLYYSLHGGRINSAHQIPDDTEPYILVLH